MLLVLMVLMVIVFTILSGVFRDEGSRFCIWLGATLAMIVAITLIEWGARAITKDAFIATNQERYEMLVYQLENDVYDNDNDLGKYELYSEIREWNEALAKEKSLQRNFWVGLTRPNMYDDFEFIRLEDGQDG